jgi:hypothetical protein
MHRSRLALVASPLFLTILLLMPGCATSRYAAPRHVIKLPLACHQIGLDFDIGVDRNNRVTSDPACVDKKQKIRWKRVEGDKGFRIQFLNPKTPIRPLEQDCKNECRAEILPEAQWGDVWPYAVTDLATGQKYDPVIIIDGCCP